MSPAKDTVILSVFYKVDHLGEFVVLWKKGARVLSVGNLLVRKDGKVYFMVTFSTNIVK